MDANLEKTLADSLDALESGRTVEQILAGYPEEATELRPFLETVEQLSAIRVAHSLEAQALSRQQLFEQAEALRLGAARSAAPRFGFKRLFYSLGSAALAVILLFTIVAFVSSSAVPGDGLYRAKRAIEGIRSALTTDPSQRDLLATQLEQERVREIKLLLEENRNEEVEFTGSIEALAAESWVISGIPVQFTADTNVEGESQLGALVQVTGRTEAGKLFARKIMILAVVSPTPSPTPTATPPPTATPNVSSQPIGPGLVGQPTPTAPAPEDSDESFEPDSPAPDPEPGEQPEDGGGKEDEDDGGDEDKGDDSGKEDKEKDSGDEDEGDDSGKEDKEKDRGKDSGGGNDGGGDHGDDEADDKGDEEGEHGRGA